MVEMSTMISSGARIGSGYVLLRSQPSGPIGVRWLAQSPDGSQRLIDIVNVAQSPYLKALCENSSLCKDEFPHPKNVINLLEVGWVSSEIYYQVLDLATDAQRLSEMQFAKPLTDLELWRMAGDIVGGIHRIRTAVGAVVPHSLYVQAGSICVGDYWWGHHMAGGGPYCKALASFLPDHWPLHYLPFLAPEALKGEEITSSADVFSIGVVLFKLLTGVYPRNIEPSYNHAAYRHELLMSKYYKITELRTGLNKQTISLIQQMLATDEKARVELIMLDVLIKHIKRDLGEPVDPEDEWIFR